MVDGKLTLSKKTSKVREVFISLSFPHDLTLNYFKSIHFLPISTIPLSSSHPKLTTTHIYSDNTLFIDNSLSLSKMFSIDLLPQNPMYCNSSAFLDDNLGELQPSTHCLLISNVYLNLVISPGPTFT